MGHASVRAGPRGARRTGQSAASDERQRAVVGDSGDETAPGRAHRCRQLIAPSPMPSISDRTASGTDGTSNALPPTAPRFQPAPSRTSTAAIPRRPPRIPIRRAGRSRSSRPRTGPPGRRATPRRARARTCPRRTGRRRCRRATPPRPRPTPTPGHPRDQPRISRTSRRPDQQQNHGFRGSFSATGRSDAGTQLVIHFSGHATFFNGAPRISTEHLRVTGCVTE
jgi:hypothetical protein